MKVNFRFPKVFRHSAGLIDAKVVRVDEANDLALLKADGEFSSLPISSSRSAQLGGTVATVGFQKQMKKYE